MSEPTLRDILHILRNPHGWSPDAIRAAQLAACDLLESAAAPVPDLEAENLRLRKIAAHVPGRIYMEAKEKAGYGVQVKAMDAAPVPARE